MQKVLNKRIKRATPMLQFLNRAKLRFLQDRGVNVTIDGSWGPWLEQQYLYFVNNPGSYRTSTPLQTSITSNNNSNTAAVPMAIAAPATAIGAYALPTITASEASLAVPAAMIAGSLASGAYDNLNGVIHSIHVSPEQREAMAYANDATRVADLGISNKLRGALAGAKAGYGASETLPAVRTSSGGNNNNNDDDGWDFGVWKVIKKHPYLSGSAALGGGYTLKKHFGNDSNKVNNQMNQTNQNINVGDTAVAVKLEAVETPTISLEDIDSLFENSLND